MRNIVAVARKFVSLKRFYEWLQQMFLRLNVDYYIFAASNKNSNNQLNKYQSYEKQNTLWSTSPFVKLYDSHGTDHESQWYHC